LLKIEQPFFEQAGHPMFALIQAWPSEQARACGNGGNYRNSAGVLAVAPGEAARLTGVGRTTIYEAIGAGTLRSVKIGRRRLITVEALRAWLLAHEVAV
jgi:excisionase family DNA binding protein